MKPVMKLTEPAVYRGTIRLIAVDNWYTSVELVLALMDRDFHFCGTIKRNKTKIPKSALFPKTGAEKKNRGEILCKRLTDKELYFTAWQDSNPVHCLSTWSPLQAPARRRTVENGRYLDVEFPRPTVIAAYNKAMGGTDKFDQFESYYDDRYRSKTWQIRLIYHFLHAATINASIIFYHNSKKGRMSALLQFTRLLIVEWAYNIKGADDPEEYNDIVDKSALKLMMVTVASYGGRSKW